MKTKSVSKEDLPEIINQINNKKLCEFRQKAALSNIQNVAKNLTIRSNGKGRKIGSKKICKAVSAVNSSDFNKIKKKCTPKQIRNAAIQEVAAMPDEVIHAATKNKRVLKKFIYSIISTTITRLIAQELFKCGANILGGLGLAGGGANAVAAATTENFYATVSSSGLQDMIEHLTAEQQEIFAPFIERLKEYSGSSGPSDGGLNFDIGEIFESVMDSITEGISQIDWGDCLRRLIGL